MFNTFSGLKGLSAFKYTAISGAATTLVVTYTCVAFFNFVFTSYTYGKMPSKHKQYPQTVILAKFRREVNPDMPEQLFINNLCDTNRNLSFYKEYIHERSEILCGLSVTCINLFNGIILLLACCLDCKELLFKYFKTVFFNDCILGTVYSLFIRHKLKSGKSLLAGGW